MQHWALAVLEQIAASCNEPIANYWKDLERIAKIVCDKEVYAFRTEKREEIACYLSDVRSLDELSRLMWSAAVECGFQYSTVFVLRQGIAPAFKSRIFTSYPEKWVKRYQEKKYQLIDPILKRATESECPFLFSELQNPSPIVDSFWKDAEEHGIGRQGICMAFDLAYGARIGISFSTNKSEERFIHDVAFDGLDAITLGYIGADAFNSISRDSRPSSSSLNFEELSFLNSLILEDDCGGSLQDSISIYGSAEAMKQSIFEKLGVKSIMQAVAIASRNSWFDELLFEEVEVYHTSPNLRRSF